MAIYNIGSTYYLGNVKFGTFNPSYPSTPYLIGFPHASISAEISALCTAAGLLFRNVLPQADFNTYTQQRSLLAFGANGDIDDRYVFDFFDLKDTTGGFDSGAKIYNNSGYTATNNTISATNRLATANMKVTSAFNYGFGLDPTLVGSTASDIAWFGAANSNALALGVCQHFFTLNQTRLTVLLAGILNAVPTDFNYYSASNISKSIAIASHFRTSSASTTKIEGRHYIANTEKYILQTGFAEYNLNGSTAQWSADFLPHEDNATIGYPTMGEDGLLRIFEGSYTIGKPIKVTGDSANRIWLPFGQWTPNRKIALQLYSA